MIMSLNLASIDFNLKRDSKIKFFGCLHKLHQNRTCTRSFTSVIPLTKTLHSQWRRQLECTWARSPPWRSREFFFAKLYVETIVWFGLVLCQTLSSSLFVQPYSLWNDTITGYNGACAKVNVVFTARRYALARSLLSAGVCPFLCPSRSYVVSRWLMISSNFFFDQVATSFQFFFNSKRRYPIPREPRKLGRKIHGGEKNLRFSTEIATYLINGTR